MSKTRNYKTLSIIAALTLVVSFLFTGCVPNANNNANNSGSITAVGSSAMQPLVEKAAQQFMSKNAGTSILVQGGGSGTGLSQVYQGGAQIGNSDLFAEEKLKPEESATLVDHKVCVSGFATIVNPKVSVDNLSQQQLIDIFTGKITNWKDVGGNDTKIVIINRPKSSGTRATFNKYALNGAKEAEGKALTVDSSGAVKKTVAETDGAIAYLSLSNIDDTIKVLKFEGVEPTHDNIASGNYTIWSYEHMYTKGEPTGTTKAFLDYMASEEVKSIITQLGYIPASDMTVSR